MYEQLLANKLNLALLSLNSEKNIRQLINCLKTEKRRVFETNLYKDHVSSLSKGYSQTDSFKRLLSIFLSVQQNEKNSLSGENWRHQILYGINELLKFIDQRIEQNRTPPSFWNGLDHEPVRQYLWFKFFRFYHINRPEIIQKLRRNEFCVDKGQDSARPAQRLRDRRDRIKLRATSEAATLNTPFGFGSVPN